MADKQDNPQPKSVGFGGSSLPVIIQTGNTTITISSTKPRRKRKAKAKGKARKRES